MPALSAGVAGAPSLAGEPPMEGSVRSMMRFTVRKVKNGWMVWDTATRSVAVADEMPAIRLSEKTAQRFADMLNSQDKLGERPPKK